MLTLYYLWKEMRAWEKRTGFKYLDLIKAEKQLNRGEYTTGTEWLAKVRCLDNTDLEVSLTIGQEYRVLAVMEPRLVQIVDDSGETYWHSFDRFEVVK